MLKLPTWAWTPVWTQVPAPNPVFCGPKLAMRRHIGAVSHQSGVFRSFKRTVLVWRLHRTPISLSWPVA